MPFAFVVADALCLAFPDHGALQGGETGVDGQCELARGAVDVVRRGVQELRVHPLVTELVGDVEEVHGVSDGPI